MHVALNTGACRRAKIAVPGSCARVRIGQAYLAAVLLGHPETSIIVRRAALTRHPARMTLWSMR